MNPSLTNILEGEKITTDDTVEYQLSTHEKQAEFAKKRDASLNEYMKQAQELWNDSCTSPRKPKEE
jgi:hypothetical protein